MTLRRAFTLVEIMVSIMIFTVVGGAMLGILLLATDLYRRGEAGRSANDEAIAVLAALDADLARIVPPNQGGFFYADVHDSSGNTLIAFKTAARDRSTIGGTGTGARSLVAWWVDGQQQLRRAERPEPPRNAITLPTNDEDYLELDDMVVVNGSTWPVLTSGCLHFGAWLSLDSEPRASLQDWRTVAGYDYPSLTASFQFGGAGSDPFPRALLITLGLTGGGRFAAQGFTVEDVANNDTAIRIAGFKGLPTNPGSMLRIGDEWVGYNGYSNGTIACPKIYGSRVGRGQRRSLEVAHPAKTPVRLAQTYSLVRDLPR